MKYGPWKRAINKNYGKGKSELFNIPYTLCWTMKSAPDMTGTTLQTLSGVSSWIYLQMEYLKLDLN